MALITSLFSCGRWVVPADAAADSPIDARARESAANDTPSDDSAVPSFDAPGEITGDHPAISDARDPVCPSSYDRITGNGVYCTAVGVVCNYPQATCVCESCGGGCLPRTCVSLGAHCGLLGDGCGGLLNCGTCPPGQTCGGNGVANECGGADAGCVRRTCLPAVCGLVDDGCGGRINCDACPSWHCIPSQAGCPATLPTDGDACAPLAQTCAYEVRCCPVYSRCANGRWVSTPAVCG